MEPDLSHYITSALDKVERELKVNGPAGARELALVKTKLQEAKQWLREAREVQEAAALKRHEEAAR